MVGRTLSDYAKSIAQRRTINKQYQLALDAYKREQAKTDGSKKRGLRPIAAEYNVCYRTLGNLINGGQSMSAFNASKQKLSYAEERVLVDFILHSADRGIPLTHDNVRAHANGILEARGESPVGKNWVDRFITRYREEVQAHWSRPLATERAKSLNPEAVKAWFDLVEELVVKKGIKRENIYGMDESGFPPSNQGRQRVLGRRGTKTQHKQGNANRENVTVIVTICGDGTSLKPTIIFKGKNFMSKWAENNVSDAS